MGKSYKPTGKPVGRPCKFESPEELWRCAEAYFKDCEETGEPVLITGFCVYIDSYRDYITELAETKPEFSPTIKRIKEKIAASYEKGGRLGQINAAQAIFMQKNLGFTDKQEIDVKLSGSVSLSGLEDEAK